MHPPAVGLYTCGPTVYNYLHVGNYRSYIFEDVLRRSLECLGYKVKHVMNITDVGHLTSDSDDGEDKLEVGAARTGKTAWEVAEFYTKAFIEDSQLLNFLAPHVLCKATDHVSEQIELVKRLEAKGFAYVIGDGVYCDTAKLPDYGKLMGPGYQEGLKAGARVEANFKKRNPNDFALWKFSPQGKKRQMEWDSPWGRGFPGWHIECSAMAMKYLGETFDIHCGGVDHIPIHHTNEIAQSEAATGKPFAKFWMHGEFLLMNNAKMAKSAGGFLTLSDLKEKGFDPLDYRYHCLTAHYRKQLDFSWESLESSKTARRRLREIAQGLKAQPAKPACAEHENAFRQALEDDLNLPGALAVVWDDLRSDLPAGSRAVMLKNAEKVLALGLFDEIESAISPDLQALIDQREQARRAKNFALADKLREELDAQGVLIKDTPQGVKWRKK